VPDPAPLTHGSSASHEATVASLATQTQTPAHIVKRLYEQELAALEANATVMTFVSIIAGRRVKNRLMTLGASDRE